MRRLLLALALLPAGCGTPEIRYPVAKPEPSCRAPTPGPLVTAGTPAVLAVQRRRRPPATLEEKARLAGNVSVTAWQQACPRYGLELEFRLPAAPRPPEDRGFWHSETARLVESLGARAPGSPLLPLVSALRAAAAAPPPYGEPLEAGEYGRLSLRVAARPTGPGVSLLLRYGFARGAGTR